MPRYLLGDKVLEERYLASIAIRDPAAPHGVAKSANTPPGLTSAAGPAAGAGFDSGSGFGISRVEGVSSGVRWDGFGHGDASGGEEEGTDGGELHFERLSRRCRLESGL